MFIKPFWIGTSVSNSLAQTATDNEMTEHGVFLEVLEAGVLLTGASGIGKSELALELITRGHRLIADDIIDFSNTAPGIITGSCPEILQDFLEVCGLGILNVRAMFGDQAIGKTKQLNLIINLQPLSNNIPSNIGRVDGGTYVHKILGCDIPESLLPVAPGRSLAVIVEAAVRNHNLIQQGYDANKDFVTRQQQFIGTSEK